MDGLTETYRGEALAWEADELGHLNMRFYFQRAGQARAAFMSKLSLHGAFKARALSTLIPVRQHVKYHKEVRPGFGMSARTGIVRMGETDMDLVHIINRSPGVLSATVVETLSHVSTRTRKAFPWPARVLAAAPRYSIEMPETAAPRNIDVDEPRGAPSLAGAKKLGLETIGRGLFTPADCDAFGYVTPSSLIGRVSDSTQHLKTAWPDLDFTASDAMSGALLEAQALHYKRPVAGDCYVICSGLRSATNHVRGLCHWILDPVTGNCWSTFTGVGCRFDLKTRRLVKIDNAALADLRRGIVKGLKP